VLSKNGHIHICMFRQRPAHSSGSHQQKQWLFTNHELMGHDEMNMYIFMLEVQHSHQSINSNQLLRYSASAISPPRISRPAHHRTQTINALASSRAPPRLKPHFSPRLEGTFSKSTTITNREDDDCKLQTHRPGLEHIEKAMEQSRRARHVLQDEGP
jgi:hypothetical protein